MDRAGSWEANHAGNTPLAETYDHPIKTGTSARTPLTFVAYTLERDPVAIHALYIFGYDTSGVMVGGYEVLLEPEPLTLHATVRELGHFFSFAVPTAGPPSAMRGCTTCGTPTAKPRTPSCI